jgi:hypothetical protein
VNETVSWGKQREQEANPQELRQTFFSLCWVMTTTAVSELRRIDGKHAPGPCYSRTYDVTKFISVKLLYDFAIQAICSIVGPILDQTLLVIDPIRSPVFMSLSRE